jgi:hypothetical protein
MGTSASMPVYLEIVKIVVMARAHLCAGRFLTTIFTTARSADNAVRR